MTEVQTDHTDSAQKGPEPAGNCTQDLLVVGWQCWQLFCPECLNAFVYIGLFKLFSLLTSKTHQRSWNISGQVLIHITPHVLSCNAPWPIADLQNWPHVYHSWTYGWLWWTLHLHEDKNPSVLLCGLSSQISSVPAWFVTCSHKDGYVQSWEGLIQACPFKPVAWKSKWPA